MSLERIRQSQEIGVEPSMVVERYIEGLPDKYFNNKRSALDAGCGRGRNALYLARAGYEVTGVDVNGEDLREAETRRQELGIGTQACHFIEADIRDLDNFPKRYDVVVVNEVLHGVVKDEQYDVLRDLQNRTKSIGVHLVSGYVLSESVKDPLNRARMLKPGELRRFYETAGWRIRTYFEDEPSVRQHSGRELVNSKAHLIAQSPPNALSE